MEPEHVTSIKEEYFVLLIGVSTLISSIYPPAAYVMSFVNGAGQTIFFNITNSRTQFLSPLSMRGRTMSLYALINNGGSPTGAFVFGLLGNLIGIKSSYTVLGIAMVIYFVIRRYLNNGQEKLKPSN